MKKILMFVLLIVLFSISVNAEYLSTSGAGDFLHDSGLWNQNLNNDNVSVSARTINDGSYGVPLYGDLDNDGDNEIIVLDKLRLRIFNYDNNILSLSGAESHHCNGSEIDVSPLEIFDVDGDGTKEIIFTCNADYRLKFFTWNGTYLNQTFEQDYESYMESSFFNRGAVLLKCTGTDRCIGVFSTGSGKVAPTNGIEQLGFFDSVGFHDTFHVPSPSLEPSTAKCFSYIPDLQWSDYDQDGYIEVVASIMSVDGSGAEDIYLRTYELNRTSDESWTLDNSVLVRSVQTSLNANCELYNAGKFFTSPRVEDVSDDEQGQEIIIGYAHEVGEFRMKLFDKSLNEVRQYPDSFVADGTILGNVVVGNFFTDSVGKDFCVMGYHYSDETLDLLCGTETAPRELFDPRTREFKMDTSSLWSYQDFGNTGQQAIDGEYRADEIYTAVTQQSSELYFGTNLHEVTNGYGIIALDWDTEFEFQIPALYSLTLIYENPFKNGSVSTFDIENNGQADLIVMDNNSLRYYNDAFINSNGLIEDYYINPCIDSVWKVNTSVEVRVVGIDNDNDNVRSRVILYEGTNFSQDSGFSTYHASGSEVSTIFNANVTGNFYNLQIQVNDENNPTKIQMFNLSFSVSTAGVEAGECFTNVEGIVSGDVTTAPTDTIGGAYNGTVSTDPNNNIITDSLDGVVTNSGLGYSLVWLIVMGAVALLIFYMGKDLGYNATPIIGGVEFLLIIIGSKLGYLSVTYIVLISLVSVVLIGFYIRNKFFSQKTF